MLDNIQEIVHSFFVMKTATDSTDPQELEELSRHSALSIRRRVAGNPHTPLDSLRCLAKDPRYSCRQAVSINPKFPVEEAIDLLGTDVWEVRESLVFREDLPLSYLYEVAFQEECFNVLKALSFRDNLPQGVLVALSLNPTYLGSNRPDYKLWFQETLDIIS